MAVRRATPGEALELLLAPGAREELSVATGCDGLVVGGAEWGLLDLDEVEEVLAALVDLPTVTVAVLREPDRRVSTALMAGFDVVLAVGHAEEAAAAEAEEEGATWVWCTGDELDDRLRRVVAALEVTPAASLALAQLLRLRSRLDLVDALVAESWVYGLLQAGPEFAEWLARRPQRRARVGGTGPPVVVEHEGAKVSLVLNRPEARNALDRSMRDALVESLRGLASDQTYREIVLRGNGEVFCAGGDLDEFGTFPDPTTAHLVRSTRLPAWWVARCGHRLTTVVHGECVGAGVELPAFGRQVVAAPDASFRLPEVGMGLVPGSGGTVSLPPRIGRHRTAYLAISGDQLDAALASEWGLVDRIEG